MKKYMRYLFVIPWLYILHVSQGVVQPNISFMARAACFNYNNCYKWNKESFKSTFNFDFLCENLLGKSINIDLWIGNMLVVVGNSYMNKKKGKN